MNNLGTLSLNTHARTPVRLSDGYNPVTGRFYGVNAMRSAMPGLNTYWTSSGEISVGWRITVHASRVIRGQTRAYYLKDHTSTSLRAGYCNLAQQIVTDTSGVLRYNYDDVVHAVQNAISTGMGEAGRNTANSLIRVGAGISFMTETVNNAVKEEDK